MTIPIHITMMNQSLSLTRRLLQQQRRTLQKKADRHTAATRQICREKSLDQASYCATKLTGDAPLARQLATNSQPACNPTCRPPSVHFPNQLPSAAHSWLRCLPEDPLLGVDNSNGRLGRYAFTSTCRATRLSRASTHPSAAAQWPGAWGNSLKNA